MFLPLELTLRPSRIYFIVLSMAHALALVGAWLARLPVWVQVVMTAALATSMIWSWRENSSSPKGMRVTQSGLVEILDGEWRAAEIKGQPVVLPWFVSLIFMQEGGKSKRLMLLPDSAEVDGFRKLRVLLKWGKLSQQ